MDIHIPSLSLVLLMGASSAGKSTFALKHFGPTEVLSSDGFRALICDDENNQDVTSDAFQLMHLAIEKRLKHGRLTVVDATNLTREARENLRQLCKKQHVQPVVIALDLPLEVLLERGRLRSDRDVPKPVIKGHFHTLAAILPRLRKEGFRMVHHLRSQAEIDAVRITRTVMPWDKRSTTGAFDVVGDVHGCFEALWSLLEHLGYQPRHTDCGYEVNHTHGRRLIFVGDLVDRGPKSAEVCELVMDLVKQGTAFCVLGNHDYKLMRKLLGHKVSDNPDLLASIAQIEAKGEDFVRKVLHFYRGCNDHLIFDQGRLVIAHAGLIERYQGRVSNRVRDFALYGDTTGKMTAEGLPERRDWAKHYQGSATVVYGHTPIRYAEMRNNTICVDTSCVFGGSLTAFRYPDGYCLSVPNR